MNIIYILFKFIILKHFILPELKLTNIFFVFFNYKNYKNLSNLSECLLQSQYLLLNIYMKIYFFHKKLKQ